MSTDDRAFRTQVGRFALDLPEHAEAVAEARTALDELRQLIDRTNAARPDHFVRGEQRRLVDAMDTVNQARRATAEALQAVTKLDQVLDDVTNSPDLALYALDRT